MRRQLHALVAIWTSLTLVLSGCAPTQPFYFFEDGDMSHYVGMATNLETPDVEAASLAEVTDAPQPFTLSDNRFDNLWELPLEDAVRIALENSKVMRTLGGRQASFGGQRPQQDESPDTLQRGPTQIPSVYDPAIVETDPNFGVEGALSAFDANLSSSLFWEKNERPQNFRADPATLRFFNRVFVQDRATFNAALTKRLASGTRVSLGTNTIYDLNNNPTREVPSDWNQNFEATINQPLLQGAGTLYNRIAGPFDPFNGNGTINFDGVMIARIRNDISLADFEASVRNLVNEVEGAYWNLYFGYRNLESRKVGRDSSLETWRKVYALYLAQAKGGDASSEAQAREQYFFFRSEVETAMSDLLRAESRLRYVMGLAATDGRLIAPSTEPSIAKVSFDWNEIHSESLTRSVELRQQKWRIRQRELEVVASKNLLLPRLDLTARYRWLGLGDQLINSNYRPFTGEPGSTLDGTDAFSTLASGDFQESQLGLQFQMPLGFRRELATVRNQQLLLARERSVLQDQELELSHQLAEAVRLLDTSYTLMQTGFNRVVAARRQVTAVLEAYKAGTLTLDLVLDAQRREADAMTSAYRAQADYNRNIALVHFRKGSLLEYNNILLAEGPWPGKAYFDAHRRARARDAGLYLNYGYTRPEVISRGPVAQQTGEMGESASLEGAELLPTPADPKNAPPAKPGQGTPTGPLPQEAFPSDMPRGDAPEKLPSPGPSANLKPMAGPRFSSRGPTAGPSAKRARPGVQQTGLALASGASPAAAATSDQGAFDWGLSLAADRANPAPTNAAPRKTSLNPAITRTSAEAPATDETSAAPPTSGWKRTER